MEIVIILVVLFLGGLIVLLIAGVGFSVYLFQRKKTQCQQLEQEIKKMQTMLKETGALEVGGVQRKLHELDKKKTQITQELEQAKLEYNAALNEIEQKKNTIEEYKSNMKAYEQKIKDVEQQYIEQEKSVIEKYNSSIDTYEQKIKDVEQQYLDCVDFGPEIPEAYGLYDRVLLLENSTVYKKKIDEIREKEKELIRCKAAITADTTWTVNNSLRDGNKLVNRMSKIALRAFNGECDAVIESIKSYSRIESKKNKISNIYKTINELIGTLHQSISIQYLELKFEELDIAFDYENALAMEKEELKKQREIERDDELARREFEQEIKKIEKEKTHYSNELEKMIADMKKAQDIEKNKYREKINALEEMIAELTQKQEDFQNRFANKAGYVYIISNIGSFGEGIYKIGTTRRIDPFERVNELGNASVPFKFDHVAIIFSENCYELEHSIHKRFEKNRVNRVNLWKEYFKIDKEELEQELNKIDATVRINHEPSGFEYIQSENIKNNIKA